MIHVHCILVSFLAFSHMIVDECRHHGGDVLTYWHISLEGQVVDAELYVLVHRYLYTCKFLIVRCISSQFIVLF